MIQQGQNSVVAQQRKEGVVETQGNSPLDEGQETKTKPPETDRAKPIRGSVGDPLKQDDSELRIHVTMN